MVCVCVGFAKKKDKTKRQFAIIELPELIVTKFEQHRPEKIRYTLGGGGGGRSTLPPPLTISTRYLSFSQHPLVSIYGIKFLLQI